MTKKEGPQSVPLTSQGVSIPFRIGTSVPNSKVLITVADDHMVGHESGRWESRPGQIHIGVGLTENDAATAEAVRILGSAGKLTGKVRDELTERLTSFVYAKRALDSYLQSPRGNVSTQIACPELRSLWHQYLFSGRELIDKVGTAIGKCFGLNDPPTGFNAKKLKSLREIIKRARRKGVSRVDRLEAILQQYADALLEFIALRNQEKDRKDTIAEPPRISAHGVPSGGLIHLVESGKKFDFTSFVTESYATLVGFTVDVLTD